MKKLALLIFLAFFALFACNNLEDGTITDGAETFTSFDGLSGNGSGNGTIQPGMITAGEWNDLEHWEFWQGLIQGNEYAQYQQYWEMYPLKRYSLNLTDKNSQPLVNARVNLLDEEGNSIWNAKTDIKGTAELWNGFFGPASQISEIRIDYSGLEYSMNPALAYADGINKASLEIDFIPTDDAQILFVVDATGSMGDEIQYLKTELQDIIQRSADALQNLNLELGAIFYRDEGDEYLTVSQPFTDNVSALVDFVAQQDAAGGGDYPEAVHSALSVAQQYNWSDEARARLIFLLLDAPPHYEAQVLDQIQQQIRTFSESGIKIIPISASGINKETEFLLRFMAIATNGTYTFITDHSGIGNDHIEPTVGQYEVEFLNDLIVRLIKDNCSY